MEIETDLIEIKELVKLTYPELLEPYYVPSGEGYGSQLVWDGRAESIVIELADTNLFFASPYNHFTATAYKWLRIEGTYLPTELIYYFKTLQCWPKE